jgi:hypothetical protein
MQNRMPRCVVVEIPESAAGGDAQPRDLLPWADPYIARLLSKHRLKSALDDSLRFVEDQLGRFQEQAGKRTPGGPDSRHSQRFASHPGLDGQAELDSQWDGGLEWRFD